MGSLRKMLRRRLPSLASLWSDQSGYGGGTAESDCVERADAAVEHDPAYSKVQKRESTDEMMRECPEIIEDVVEMRYNTGTIVRPHMRPARRRPPAQAVFDAAPADTDQSAWAAGAEAGSDSGLSSKHSDSELPRDASELAATRTAANSDTYAVPKSDTYALPRSAVAERAAAADCVGRPRQTHTHGSSDSQAPPSEQHYLEVVDIVTAENVYLEPKTAQEIERDRLNSCGQRLATGPSEWTASAEPAFAPPRSDRPASWCTDNAGGDERRGGSKRHSKSSAASQVQSYEERGSIMLHKARSLQSLQQCFIEVQTTEPKMRNKTGFRLHANTTVTEGGLTNATEHQHRPDVLYPAGSVDGNFVLRPARRLRADQQRLQSALQTTSTPTWGRQQAVLSTSRAVDEALEEVGSPGSTLERGYERLPLRSQSAEPAEPLYVNSCEVQQQLTDEPRRRRALEEPPTDGGADTFWTEKLRRTQPAKSKRRSGGRAVDAAGGADREAQPEPTETLVALGSTSVLFSPLSPSSGERSAMRRSCSTSDLAPMLFSRRAALAPVLAGTTSLTTACRLQRAQCDAYRGQAEQPARPASAAPSGRLASAWLTVSALWLTLRRWTGTLGGAVSRAAGPLGQWVGIRYMSAHRNHPWLPDLACQPDLDYWVQRAKKRGNGFEELRKYIKHGGDFCKELASILQERSDLEVSYAKSLQKLATKLLKSSKEGLGSVNQAWQMVGAEMEYEANVHKTLAVAYTEELVKPLKGLTDTQHRVRKSVETMVDKTAKNLAEWRSAEAKAKKNAYQCARGNERAEEQAFEARLGRGKQAAGRETSKADSRRQKTEKAMAKADTDYYNFCVRGERARLEWETAVNKGTQCFQALEEERLARLSAALRMYHRNMTSLGPNVAQRGALAEPVACADVARDVQTVINVKGAAQAVPEQLLPDFYAEDMTNAMNRDRRKKALQQFMQLIRQDVGRERRGKNGVENLAKAMQQSSNFGGEGSQEDVHEKLQHMRSMLAYLEASRYKLQVSLAELEGEPRPQHPLSRHIEHHKDRQGMTQSLLKVPGWVRLDPADILPESPENPPDWTADRGKASDWAADRDKASDWAADRGEASDWAADRGEASDWTADRGKASDWTAERSQASDLTADRGKADGISSNQHDSDFDEFSSLGDRSPPATTPAAPPVTSPSPPAGDVSDDVTSSPSPAELAPAVGSCRALYDYKANMNDELTIKAGDDISVHHKQEDGWWLGELNGAVGIFPASYVQEVA